MNNIASIKKEECYGCTACFNSCPFNAISMVQNKQGFLYPQIDEEKCKRCGICLTACPVLSKDLFHDLQECYGVINNNDEVLSLSTSGGAFSAIADWVVSHDGVVYGAEYQHDCVHHIRCVGDYSACRGTKYVQSYLGNIFGEISNDLILDKYVLFTGTPCQCAGLKSFLTCKKLPQAKLILVDIICHGTPSPKVFQDYVRYIEKKHKKTVVKHLFRTKDHKWKSHVEANVFEDGTVDSKSFDSQIFTNIFNSTYANRDSCFYCAFSTEKRVSDITIGDFWGCDRNYPEFCTNKGVSFVMINTTQGKLVFNDILGSINCISVSLSDTDQPNLHAPNVIPRERDLFWHYYQKSFWCVVKKMFNKGRFRRYLGNKYRNIKALLTNEHSKKHNS